MTDTATERITEFRVYARNNYRCTNQQRMHMWTYPATMAGLAEALDQAGIEAADRRGRSGAGAGAWVEAVSSVDDWDGKRARIVKGEVQEGQNVVIDSLNSAILADCEPLEIGASRLAMARRAGRLEREWYWDGDNQVCGKATHTRELIDRISN